MTWHVPLEHGSDQLCFYQASLHVPFRLSDPLLHRRPQAQLAFQLHHSEAVNCVDSRWPGGPQPVRALTARRATPLPERTAANLLHLLLLSLDLSILRLPPPVHDLLLFSGHSDHPADGARSALLHRVR